MAGILSLDGWMAAMQGLEAESMAESLEEAKVNMAINRNNAFAQAANGVGRD